MTATTRFPENIESGAFRFHDEYAWQRDDLQQVYKYCIQASIAILGGEAWVVRRVEDCLPDEPTEMRHNLDPKYYPKGSVLGRTASHVIHGILPDRDGRMVVFSWDCGSQKSVQSWQDYVLDSVVNTDEAIRNGAMESSVIEEYSNFVYYNLDFQWEAEE